MHEFASPEEICWWVREVALMPKFALPEELCWRRLFFVGLRFLSFFGHLPWTNIVAHETLLSRAASH